MLILLSGCATFSSGIQKESVELVTLIQTLNESLKEKEGITSIAISPDGKELFYTKSIGRWAIDQLKSNLYTMQKINGRWTKTSLATFAGDFNNSGPSFAPDGRTLFFISKRPTPTGDVSSNIWKVEKSTASNWGTPIFVEEVNSPKSEYSPKVLANGDLYFASSRVGGLGQGDLYVAKLNNGTYSTPENLGATINSDKGEWNLHLSSDGKTLLFEASQRPQNASPFGDLYISFLKNNSWSVPQNIKELNTTGSELNPILVNDEQLLIYTSTVFLKNRVAKLFSRDFQPILAKYYLEK